MTIHILPEEVSEKIAAGEVIARPASVVKELVENSIDAKASRISVYVERAGKGLIRVTDDGCGIPLEQLSVAFEHHATSKVGAVEDLDSISTMGFRGEALASVAAVSEVSVISRPADSKLGGRFDISYGKKGEPVEAGAPVGTTIEVRQLFSNLPARLKFLKTDRTEWGRIASVVTHAALMFPGTAFELTREDETVMRTEARSCLAERVADLFDRQVSSSLLPVSGDVKNVEVDGLIGTPALSRSNMNMVHTFVNRRYVRVPAVMRALKDAYGEYIARGRCPVAFLCIDVPPGSVDVNVHPAKEEVRFRDVSAVHRAVSQAVSAALSEAGSAREYFPPEDRSAPRRVAQPRPVPSHRDGPAPSRSCPGLAEIEHHQRPLIELQPGDESVHCIQIHDSYIVIEDERGVMIADQHALHERVLLEEMKTSMISGRPAKQGLLVPVNVEMTPEEKGRLDEVRDSLLELGLTVEDFGGNTVVIRSVPALLKNVDPADLLLDVLDNVEPVEDREGCIRNVMGLMACKAAVKAGDRLSEEELAALVRGGRKIGFSGACAHGRPTHVLLTLSELERMFERT